MSKRALTKQTSYVTGLKAERMAYLFFTLKGYRLLEQRYKTPVGEIDLVFKRGKTVVFVEVKCRDMSKKKLLASFLKALFSHQRSFQTSHREWISLKQRQRIARAALYWQQRKAQPAYSYRFDAFFLTEQGVEHVENAWEAEF